MSEMGQSLPKWDVRATSAFPLIATEERTSRNVSSVPWLCLPPGPTFGETAAEYHFRVTLEAEANATTRLTRASVPAAKVADTTGASSTQWCRHWAISKPRLPRLLLVCRAIGVKNECIR